MNWGVDFQSEFGADSVGAFCFGSLNLLYRFDVCPVRPHSAETQVVPATLRLFPEQGGDSESGGGTGQHPAVPRTGAG